MTKKIYLFVPIFLILLGLFTSLANVIQTSNLINQNILRLHIIANSDEDFDQELKLSIRDEVLKLTNDLFTSTNNINDAINIAKKNINNINILSQSTAINQGYNYNIKTIITKEYFDTRYYDGFTLPAGYYNSIKIIIGKGKGHNWWCVLYPSVCISGCVDDFNNVLTNDEYNLITNNKYIPKFKIVEIYNKLKYKIIS